MQDLSSKRRGSFALFLDKIRLRSDSLPSWFPVAIHEEHSLVPFTTIQDKRINGGQEEEGQSSTVQSGTNNLGRESDTDFRRQEFTLVPISYPSEESRRRLSRRRGNDALGIVLSALYGKMLIVMGIAFPMAEVISTYIPPSFYDGFYLYLYFGSLVFMGYIYVNAVRQKATRSVRVTINKLNALKFRRSKDRPSSAETDLNGRPSRSQNSSDSEPLSSGGITPFSSRRSSAEPHNKEGEDDVFSDDKQGFHFGSFYLRIGALAFGIGSMIYSGLEFGQYFELVQETKCHNIMIALTPAVRMIFTFGQMYFIFVNSKVVLSSLRLAMQFGLMHMIGTNLCVWLNVLVQETRHEILHFYNPDSPNSTYQLPILNLSNPDILSSGHHHRDRRGLRGPHSIYECRRTDIFGSLVQTSSQFLFPCTIEYSLICAAILYVMWRSIVKRRAMKTQAMHYNLRRPMRNQRSPHHYSVDCAHAHKGLFVGIFAFVMTVISLILFFVLTGRPGYQAIATLEVNVTEVVLYTVTTLVVLIAMCQYRNETMDFTLPSTSDGLQHTCAIIMWMRGPMMRELRFTESRNLELDNILLIVSQTGSIIYNIFTIIAGHFALRQNTTLMMVTAVASLIQLIVQTLFILDASKRCASNADQARRKPGREIVTFLLVTNLAMWLINTLEKSRADSQTVQLKFYGVWAWTIITQSAMPLAIFYRFHSTVCLCDIWKKTFKLKTSNHNHHNPYYYR